MTRGIYQGWTGWRNLGDEAMFVACQRTLARLVWTACPPFDAQRAGPAARARTAWRGWMGRVPGGERALLGGGTLINRTPEWLHEYRRLRRGARKPVPVFSPGVAHPDYWARTPTWKDTRVEWREALAELPEVGVRGPVSRQLLVEAGVRNVVVTGDPGLVFRRRSPRRHASRCRIGINAGRSNGEMWGSEDRMLAALTDGARRLAAHGCEVRLFPVWDRDEVVCREVAAGAGLPPDVVDPLLLDPDAFVEYVDGFDVVITVKLHAAVLAAAAGVPFVAIEYRPKVRDFSASVGCESRVVRSSDVVGAALARDTLDLYENLPVARAQLESRVTELAETFEDYARRLEGLLLS